MLDFRSTKGRHGHGHAKPSMVNLLRCTAALPFRCPSTCCENRGTLLSASTFLIRPAMASWLSRLAGTPTRNPGSLFSAQNHFPAHHTRKRHRTLQLSDSSAHYQRATVVPIPGYLLPHRYTCNMQQRPQISPVPGILVPHEKYHARNRCASHKRLHRLVPFRLGHPYGFAYHVARWLRTFGPPVGEPSRSRNSHPHLPLVRDRGTGGFEPLREPAQLTPGRPFPRPLTDDPGRWKQAARAGKPVPTHFQVPSHSTSVGKFRAS
jgi:hypothetical protein